MNTRTCCRCKIDKLTSEFYKNCRNKDGLQYHCRSCQAIKDRSISSRYSRARTQSRKSGRGWIISKARYAELVVLPCHYCGGPIEPTGKGVDRKDSLKPYSDDNCVPACVFCNQVKNANLNEREMLQVGKLIRQFKAERARNGEPPLMPWQQLANDRITNRRLGRP